MTDEQLRIALLVAVQHTVQACKAATGQHRVIDHFVNKVDIANEVLAALRDTVREAKATRAAAALSGDAGGVR